MNIKLWLKLALPLVILTAFTGLATAQQKSERNFPHPPSPTCRMDAAGMCGGVCPNGQACKKKGPGVCGCEQEVPTCASIPGTKSCGGPCKDPRLVCQKVEGVGGQPDKCDCVPPPPRECALIPGTNMCGGPCKDPKLVCQKVDGQPDKPCQ